MKHQHYTNSIDNADNVGEYRVADSNELKEKVKKKNNNCIIYVNIVDDKNYVLNLFYS